MKTMICNTNAAKNTSSHRHIAFQDLLGLLIILILSTIMLCLAPYDHIEAATKSKEYKLTATIYEGKTFSIREYLSNNTALKNEDFSELTYSSANKKIATISKDGKIKGVSVGKTTISITLTTVYAGSNGRPVEKKSKAVLTLNVIPYDNSTSSSKFNYEVIKN